MINEIAPILFVLGGAVLLLIAARKTRRMHLPEGIGSGVVLWILAIGALLILSRRPAWLAVGATEDRLLSYARMVGLTGLLFLAGTRFDLAVLRHKGGQLVRIGLVGLLVLAGAILLFGFFGHQEPASVVLLAATVVASSIWYTAADRSDGSVDGRINAAVLSAIALAAVYFFEIFHALPHGRVSATAYVVVAMYESLKLVLLFASGYFICTRFLARAAGRISSTRTAIGFALISILIFVLSFIATSQLIAVAWAFVAGALWRGSSVGAAFSETERPVAAALLMAFTFLSPLLQLHGRTPGGVTLLPILLLIAVLVKAVCVAVAARRGKATTFQTASSAAAIALPGEMAILLLGFAVTRWLVDSSVYFTLIGYAFLSTLVIPATQWLSTRKRQPAVELRSKTIKRTVKAVVGLFIFLGAIVSFSSSKVLAQQPATNQNVQLGRGMSVIAPGFMEIGSKTNLFLNLADKIPLTAEQKKKLEDLVLAY